MSIKEIVTFTDIPGRDSLNLTVWKPEGAPKAVVQLLHGMAEHIERYDWISRRLCDDGYVVAGHNHRGHGAECKKEELGYFAKKNGWLCLIEDAHQISARLKDMYPALPFVLLGHSMGSFAAREYAIRYGNELNALVLSGTGFYSAPLCLAGQIMAKLSAQKKPTGLVDKLAFSGNNKPFEPARTSFDWLSRDQQEVDKYIADDRCGFVFTGSAFADFFGGLRRLTDVERLKKMPSDLPVYFLSGDHDPVGQMGKGVLKTAKEFEEAGLNDITVKLYAGGRHEMFNEINRREVAENLAEWLDKAILRGKQRNAGGVFEK